MGGIYGLSSSRDRKIRYVGKADNFVRREYEHRHNEVLPPLANWIKRERHHGFDLVFEIIEGNCWDNLHDIETYWINRLPDLLNRRYRAGYKPLLEPHERALLAQIKKRPLGYVENWQGYVGLRYYPRSETWQVHVQTPGPHYWLMGDGGSWLQIGQRYTWRFGHSYAVGDHHFLRWEGALKARDQRRTEYERGASPLTRLYLSWPNDDPRLHRNHIGIDEYDLDLDCLLPTTPREPLDLTY